MGYRRDKTKYLGWLHPSQKGHIYSIKQRKLFADKLRVKRAKGKGFAIAYRANVRAGIVDPKGD